MITYVIFFLLPIFLFAMIIHMVGDNFLYLTLAYFVDRLTDMALAGITSRIPPDQIVDAMGAVGRRLDESLRETGRGGLAATPEGKRIAQEFYK